MRPACQFFPRIPAYTGSESCEGGNMQASIPMWITGTILLAAMALPAEMAAQSTRYKLIDMGTFGGPASYLTDPGNGPGFSVLNDAGVLVGRSDTSTYDPLLGDFRAH